jgi:hypothetical protein
VAVLTLSVVAVNYARRAGRLLQRVEDWHTTPTLADLRVGVLGGADVKYREYSIGLDDDLDALVRAARPAVRPYPTFHVPPPGIGDVAFHPWQWSQNLIAATAAAEIESLLVIAEPFVTRTGDGDFYRYPFVHTVGDVTLQPPWYSAFAQGHIVAAFVRLHRQTGEAKWLERARRALMPVLVPASNRSGAEPWVTFVEEKGYVWFEDYADAAPGDPRVLNGHIQALMGIYAFHRVEPSDGTLLALRAGITTVQRYFAKVRRPGHDIRYGAGLGELRDNGQQRAANLLGWLHRLTNDAFFAAARDAVLTDMKLVQDNPLSPTPPSQPGTDRR